MQDYESDLVVERSVETTSRFSSTPRQPRTGLDGGIIAAALIGGGAYVGHLS